MMLNLFVLWMLISPMLSSPQRDGENAVRIRLFAASRPVELRILRDNVPAQRVRVSGTRLFVDERAAGAVLRLTPPLRIQVPGNEVVVLRHPAEITVQEGALLLVSTIPREDYVAGVLAGEAASFRSDESLKAMAVAARTYAAFHGGRHRSEGFDFCDTTHCQDFRAVAVTSRIERAVAATRGELLWYQGAVFEALYHQDCGGITEAHGLGRAPIHDSYCTANGRKPWTTEITRAELQAALQINRIENVAIVTRSPSGRAATVRVDGAPSRTLQAEAFRLAIGRTVGWNRLRSDLYEVRRSGEGFIFEGYGAGHGLGMCQNGAAAMGEIGKTYREILAFYYPGTIVGQSASGLAWIRSGGIAADLESVYAQDSSLLDTIEQRMQRLAETTGLQFGIKPLVRIYPTVSAYRDATGEPGWIAASTRGNIVRLQPSATLRSKGILETTIAHELAHLLIESHAKASVPLWFREGLVLWLTEPEGSPAAKLPDLAALDRSLSRPASEAELRQAYRDAKAAVANLAERYGRETVLSWVRSGLPRLPGG